MVKLLRTLHDAAYRRLLQLPLPLDLNIQPGRAGFFGEVFMTLNGIRLAELNQKRARVRWGRGSPYYEAEYGLNAWNYFFKEAEFNFPDYKNLYVPKLRYRPAAYPFVPYSGLTIRQSLSRAILNWCQPHTEIADTVAKLASEMFQGLPTLGVHVRLTDAAKGAEGRKTIGIDNVMAAVDVWLESVPSGKIFLATDDHRTIDTFEQRYQERLVFQDCIRSRDGTSIHGHYDQGVEGSSHKKGREVLIDALLLARCKHLIRTHSRVTAFSLCWNLELTYTDLERELLNVDRTPWLHN